MSAQKLLSAAAASFILPRAIPQTARLFHLDPSELQAQIQAHRDLSYQGQLEIALQNRPKNPTPEQLQLWNTRVHLARLEQHYAFLVHDLDQAHLRCDRLRSQKEGFDDNQLQKAELIANRIEGQIQRNLKELRNTERELKKSLAATEEATPVAKAEQPKATQPKAMQPQTVAVPEKATVEKPIAAEPTAAKPAAAKPTQPVAKNEEPTAQTSELPTHAPTPPAPPCSAEDQKRIFAKHHRLIQYASPANRQTLIAQLLAAERAAESEQSQPPHEQNGKHAA